MDCREERCQRSNDEESGHLQWMLSLMGIDGKVVDSVLLPND